MFAPRALLAAIVVLSVLLPPQFALAGQSASAPRAIVGDRAALAAGSAAPATNQLLIGFAPGTTAAERAATVAARGGKIIRTFESINALLIAVPAGRAAASDFAADTTVRYAELNAPIYPARIPDDPDYANSGLWGLGKIDARTAWETATGGSGVVVGVVDSGIDYTHPNLAANVWTAPPGWDVNGCGAGTRGYRADPVVTSCDPLDEYGHGTHVAGTIGATGDDGRGITGVNWRVTLMPLRFMAADGSGNTAGAIAAIDYAVQAKQRGVNLRVLNLSWTTRNVFSQSLYDELKVASDNGILIVTAAGNEGVDNGTTPSYPANFATQAPGDPFAAAIPNMIAVAASDRNDNLGSFDGYASNYSASRVQLAAPGVDVYSTLPGGGYGTLSGTSMATPHVSGAAALLLSAPGFRDLTAAQLRDRLLRCSDTTSGLSGKVANGRLNVARALRGTGGCAAAPTYALTLSAGSGGTATVDPIPGPYPVGTTVAISAQPQGGYGLAGWTIDGVASNDMSNPLNLTMNVPRTVVATFARNNAAPQIGTLSPTMLPAGSGRFVLTVNGSGFARGAVVRWNGTALATSFVNATQLQAIVPDTLVANQGAATVGVSNPTPGGGLTSTNFAIGPAEQSIGFDPLPSRQLGASPFTVTASAIGAPLTFSATGACAVGATTTAGTATTATVTLTDLGDCGLTATQTGGGALAPASTTRHFTVTQGVPTLAWANPAAITYGAALDTTILDATASVPGTFRYAPAAGTVLPAGEHTLTVTFTPADTTRYATITRMVPLTVAKAPLTVTARAADGIYGQPLTPFTATYNGFVNGDTAQRALDGALTFATSATDRSPVGQYQVTPGGLTAANYALTFAVATLTIAPAPLTVTANDRTRPTGVADPAFAVAYSGFIPGEDQQVLGGAPACTTTATATSPVGTYPIACGGLTATNYTPTYRPGTLTIVNAPVALNVLPVSATVGQQSATLVARSAAQAGAAPSGTVTFTVTQGATVIGTPTDAPIDNGAASASFPVAMLAAGDYTVTATIAASGGNPAVSGSGTLTIVRQSQALAFAAPATRQYGEAAFALTATASSGLAVAFSVPTDGPCSLAGATVRLDRAGICTVTAMQPGDATTLPAPPVARSFTIVRGSSSLRWNTPASIVYGTPIGATQLAATSGDDRAGVITYDPPPGTILGAGTHTLTAYFTPTASDTFASATATITITVTPAPLTLTALDSTVTYGAPLPAFAVEVRGLVNGDTPTSLGVGANPSGSATAPLPVATYALAPAATTGGDYTITTNVGSLTVLPRTLTLTVSDATRAYGANNPAFDLRYDGFADGESAPSLGLTPTCATLADATSPPGTYPLVCDLPAPTNYRVRSLPGALTVTPAPQSLAFTAPADRMLSATTGTLAATASSGLPVTFFVAPGSPCVVAGTTLTLLSVGPCVITARQGGDARYAAATELARTVQILPLPAPPAPSPIPTPIPPPTPTATPIPPPPPPTPIVAPPPKSCAQTAAVMVARGSGTVSPTTVCVGVPTALTASPGNRQLFIGWAIDGTVQSYTNPLQLTLTSGHTVTALFGPTQDFPDLTASAMKEAIDQLAARGIVKGYADGSFGPNDTTLRAQMAALIARAMGWDAEDRGNPFADRGPVDADLWRNVGTLAYHNVARGYGDGTYNPTAPVLAAQTISFITRAMVAKGYWQSQPDNGALYTNVPATSGHRADLATYIHYVGGLPDIGAGASFPGWDQPSTRGWFARALWAALQTQFARSTLP